jgi:cell division transport system permease protein
MGRLVFFIREALRALRRSAAPSVAAIVTIVVTVLLLGVLIPVLWTTQGKANDVRDQIGLRVFLYDDATNTEINRLEDRIGSIDHVTDVEFVSKAQAKTILKGRLEDPNILGELNSNPLPASFDVSLDSPDNLEAVRSDLTPPGASGKPEPISPVIEEVQDSRSEASQIRSVTGAIKIVLLVISGLLLAASLMLVGNTIRLSIYARRREVEVMRLVGATNWFIRWPFMIEGLIVGLLGAASAVAILWLGKVTVVDPLANDFALVSNLQTIAFIPLIAVLVACAMAVSALGSGITLRRFLQV